MVHSAQVGQHCFGRLIFSQTPAGFKTEWVGLILGRVAGLRRKLQERACAVNVLTLFHGLARPLFDGLSGGWADVAPRSTLVPVRCNHPHVGVAKQRRKNRIRENHLFDDKNFSAVGHGAAAIADDSDRTLVAPPKLVCLEMDCYWMTQAGRDPVAMLMKYGSRIQLLHLKGRKAGFPTSQMLGDDAERMTEFGSGTIDRKAVISAAEKTGLKYYFIKRDNGSTPAFDSLRISYDYLKIRGLGSSRHA